MADFAVLPPGVSSEEFAAALDEFRALLGEENVIVAMDQLSPYRKIMIPAEEMAHASSGALTPTTVEEIQGIVGICNKYKVPIWTISTGRNFGYGSAAPVVRGTMILDLRKMNRIIHIDPDFGTALVEPGVTYWQLQNYLKENNLPFWLDFPAPGPIVGPVGNTLERGIGYTPYSDHFAMSCGMEVVLANGEILRTGMGAIPNSKTWQIFRYGYGPYLDGIFTQSNYGIVTKLGFWLMPAPASYKTILVQYPSPDDLVKAVDTVRPLRISGVINNTGLIAPAAGFMCFTTTRADIWDGPGPVPNDVIQAEAQARGISPVNVMFTLYGTEERIAADFKLVQQAFEASGGTITVGIPLQDQTNELNLFQFGLYNWVGGGGSAFCAPVGPCRGEDAALQWRIAQEVMAPYGYDALGGWTINGRDLHLILGLEYDRTIPGEIAKARECFDKLTEAYHEAGYGIYRTNIASMNHLADLYGPVNRSVNQAIKRALDPNGILAPGKSGIYN